MASIHVIIDNINEEEFNTLSTFIRKLGPGTTDHFVWESMKLMCRLMTEFENKTLWYRQPVDGMPEAHEFFTPRGQQNQQQD